MSDQTIREGDLCVVVRPTPCCGGVASLGRIFTACMAVPFSVCGKCGVPAEDCIAADVGARTAYPRSMLKKINPPAQTKETERETEAT